MLRYAPAYDLLQRVLGFPYAFVADQITAALPESHRHAAPHQPIVFDVGCATARVLTHLRGVRYIGLDPSERYVATARARFPHAEFHVSSFQGFDASELCGSVDVVVTIGLLHHISDPDVVSLSRIASKLLRRDGTFVSLDPAVIEGQHRVARLLANIDRGKFVRTPSHLEALLRSVWTSADVDVRHDLRPFPYTHVLVAARL